MKILLVEVESSEFFKRLFCIKEKILFIPLNSGIFIGIHKNELVFSTGTLNSYVVKNYIDFDLVRMKSIINHVEGGLSLDDSLQKDLRKMLT